MGASWCDAGLVTYDAAVTSPKMAVIMHDWIDDYWIHLVVVILLICMKPRTVTGKGHGKHNHNQSHNQRKERKQFEDKQSQAPTTYK